MKVFPVALLLQGDCKDAELANVRPTFLSFNMPAKINHKSYYR